jgi:hypothetical protein
MDVQLRFVNRSENGHGTEVLLFQKNVIPDMGELAIAWKVIRYCGRDCWHPFVYQTDFEVACSDDYGNYSPRLNAENGQRFAVTPTPSGRRLAEAGTSASIQEIQVVNGLSRGAINVNLFKNGRLMACKTSVAPEQKAVFQFKPTLWIGVVSQVVQGQALSSAVINSVNTEISLLGIASADIVMTGGGSGPDAHAYAFTLDKVVTA